MSKSPDLRTAFANFLTAFLADLLIVFGAALLFLACREAASKTLPAEAYLTLANACHALLSLTLQVGIAAFSAIVLLGLLNFDGKRGDGSFLLVSTAGGGFGAWLCWQLLGLAA